MFLLYCKTWCKMKYYFECKYAITCLELTALINNCGITHNLVLIYIVMDLSQSDTYY